MMRAPFLGLGYFIRETKTQKKVKGTTLGYQVVAEFRSPKKVNAFSSIGDCSIPKLLSSEAPKK